MLKKLFVNFLVILFSLFIALIIVEFGFRVAGNVFDIDYRLYLKELKNPDRLPEGLFIDNELVPNSRVLATTSDFSVEYKINSKGIRDKEYEYSKPKGKIRILAFGDSHTFGEGVSYGKRFTDILESNYENVEVLNFGVPGYGLDQELLYYASEGIKYTHDYVIIFINYVDMMRYSTDIIKENSIEFNDKIRFRLRNTSSTIYMERGDDFFSSETNTLLRNSFFLSYMKYQITRMLLKSEFEKYDKNLWGSIKNKSRARVYDKKVIFNRTKLILSKFDELVKANDAKLVVVKIDTKVIKNNDYINEEIEFHDLTENLRIERNKYSLSFKYDSHSNPKTHLFIGNKLIKILDNEFDKKQLK